MIYIFCNADVDPHSIFAFPKGARAGSLLHEIFEVLDFTTDDRPAIKKIVSGKLEQYGFEAHWEETIAGMITRVLNAMLPQAADGPTLSRVGKDDRLSELEFYVPLQPITPGKLSKIFAEYRYNSLSTQFPERIEELAFSPARGFVKGFIDLVFQFRQRFYIVDWKSNYLGNRVEDYSRKKIAVEMEERFYLLQSNLYVLALHQYLKKRQPLHVPVTSGPAPGLMASAMNADGRQRPAVPPSSAASSSIPTAFQVL